MKTKHTAMITALCITLTAGCGGGGNDVFGPSASKQSDEKSNSEPSSTPAESCIEQSCGAELRACNADCARLLDCIDRCDGDDCIQSCVQSSPPQAVAQLNAIAVCWEDNCKTSSSSSSGSSSASSSNASSSGNSTPVADVNRCIQGIAIMCGCASAADSPCTSSEKDQLYNMCVKGASQRLFDYYYCLGGRQPSSLNGCLGAFDGCKPYLPQS